jgi:ABC-2 type transport system ATP-binding protein
MIEARSLTKRFGKKTAVDDISFTINRGEIVGLLGPNGAGKSTTMSMITGYLSSTSGTVTVGGYDILEQPEKAKALIGYLPEIPPLYTDMTVKEYLNFVYDLKKCKLNRKRHLAEICDVVKITDVYGRLIKNLSKGYRQRVGLAQALIGDPQVLILDEPTVGLDPKEIVEIRNLIKRLGTQRTVILSSHILSEVQAVCERVIIMNSGVIVMDALTEDLAMAVGKYNRYGIRLAAPEDEVVPVLSRLPGVKKVEYVGSFEKGTVDIILESDKKVDIRKILFEECAKRSWYILMITPLGLSLEDIFIQLTSKQDEVQSLQGETDDSASDSQPSVEVIETEEGGDE